MTLTGIGLDYLQDFALVTSKAGLNRNLAPTNLAGLKAYMWARAAAVRRVAHGGKGFERSFKLNATGFQGVQPGGFRQTHREENLYVDTQRYYKYFGDINWLDDEIEKNKTLEAYAASGRRDLFFREIVSILSSRNQDLQIKMVNGLETVFSAVPDMLAMETRTVAPSAIYSFFAHVNEDLYGLYGQYSISGSTYTANSGVTNPFTAKQAQDLRVAGFSTKYVPTKVGYDSIGLPSSATGESNILSALKRGIRQSTFPKPPPTLGDQAEFQTISDADDLVFYTSDKGVGHFENQVIGGQDLWTKANREDPSVMNPAVRGHDIEYWPVLDTALLYDGTTHTVKTSEGLQGTVDFIGPRFYGHRRSTLYIVNDGMNWFRSRTMDPHLNVPDLSVKYCDVELNTFCEDYRAQIVVKPTTTALYSVAY